MLPRAAFARGATSFVMVGMVLSRTTSFGDLSSRMPWNDACRMRSPCGPSAEVGLDDEAGLHPFGVARAPSPPSGRRRTAPWGCERLEPPPQVARHLVGIAGSGAPGILQLPVLIIAEDERADRLVVDGRGREAADHEFLVVLALDLQPVADAARSIWRIGALGDDSFQRHLARMPEQDRAGLFEMLAETDHAVARQFFKKLLEHPLALDQRLLRQIPAVEVREIEHEIDHAVGAAVRQVLLKLGKARDAGLALGDDLAVEQGRAAGRAATASATGGNFSAQSSALRVSSLTLPSSRRP